MIENAEKIGDGLRVISENDTRITKIGKILRKTSLDEITQLINVIKGDMSLVGPRPPVTYYPHFYNDYTKEQKRRFEVRPGITGLAQVKVRNSVSWDERIKIDIEYVNNTNIFIDIKIMFLTVTNILTRKNVYGKDSTGKENQKVKI